MKIPVTFTKKLIPNTIIFGLLWLILFSLEAKDMTNLILTTYIIGSVLFVGTNVMLSSINLTYIKNKEVYAELRDTLNNTRSKLDRWFFISTSAFLSFFFLDLGHSFFIIISVTSLTTCLYLNLKFIVNIERILKLKNDIEDRVHRESNL